MRFTLNDVGCHADGACGYDHIRAVLVDMLTALPLPAEEQAVADRGVLIAALGGTMSDDDWELDAALDALNEHCTGCYFTMHEGNLLLVPEGWDES